jgi:hypothetical protein
VAYDEDLAQRVRDLLSARSDVTEKRMFGSNCFLVLGSRRMKGWVFVSVEKVDDDGLAEWVDAGADHAASLPAK